MEVQSVNQDDYYMFFRKIDIYSSKSFIDSNRHKVTDIKYLIFKDKRVRAGIILGIKDNTCASPFSSPFGGLNIINSSTSLETLDKIIIALDSWFLNEKYKKIKIILPPVFYDSSQISELSNCFQRLNYNLEINLNYHFNLSVMDEKYISNIFPNARKNLNKGLNYNLKFNKVNNKKETLKIYNVIKKNRDQRGFPLRLTFEEIIDNNKIINSDFFSVFLDSHIIASAICYILDSKIVQIIYWGNDFDYIKYKPMNFLSYNIFKYYKKMNFKFVDIGPSTENSLPNFGLCSFKKSIGCTVSNKFHFQKLKIEN